MHSTALREDVVLLCLAKVVRCHCEGTKVAFSIRKKTFSLDDMQELLLQVMETLVAIITLLSE